jgi:hypothetical protein
MSRREHLTGGLLLIALLVLTADWLLFGVTLP